MPDGSQLPLSAPVLPDAGDALDRCKQAFDARRNFTTTWERQRKLFLPDTAPFMSTNTTQGQRDRETTVDTYPQYAARVHATFLFGSIVNGDGDWFKCVAHGHDGAKDPGVLAWADEYRRAGAEILMDPSVGFIEQYFAMLQERTVYGNGCLYGGDRPGALPIVRCNPMRDTAWEAGGGHDPDDFWWRQSLSAAEWAKKFPNRMLGDKLTSALETPAGRSRPFTFVHATMENPDWKPALIDQQPRHRRYLSLWLNEEDRCLVNAAWINSNAYTAFRCTRRAAENYGRGGADEAMEEAQMAQRVRVAVIRGVEKATDPLMLLPDDGVMTPPTNEPEGAIVVRADLMGRQGDPIRYLKHDGRPDIGQQFLRDGCYAAIDRAFSRDLMTLPREPRMLDSQIIGLQEEQSRGVVPIIAPLFAPTARFIGRILDVAQRQGRLPRPPRAAEGLQLSIQFRNPLERASRLAEVRAFMQALSILMQAVQVDPGARHALKVVDGVQYCARILGVPDKLIASAKELKELLAADAKAAMQKQGMEGALDATTAAKNLGNAARGFVQPEQLAEAA